MRAQFQLRGRGFQMPINNAHSWAVSSERHQHQEPSQEAAYVWRVSGKNGCRWRFCCRLGQLSVYEEPSEHHLLTVNIGRLEEVSRRAQLQQKKLKASLPVIRELTGEEQIACWGRAVADPEARFFETLKGGPDRLGGRSQTQRAVAAVLATMGRCAPWPESI